MKKVGNQSDEAHFCYIQGIETNTLVISIFGTILRSLNSKKLKFGATIDFSEGLENTPFKTKITSA